MPGGVGKGGLVSAPRGLVLACPARGLPGMELDRGPDAFSTTRSLARLRAVHRPPVGGRVAPPPPAPGPAPEDNGLPPLAPAAQGKPYHISALYVVDLERFRELAAGDKLRIVYDQLAKDPNSLSNLDQVGGWEQGGRNPPPGERGVG